MMVATSSFHSFDEIARKLESLEQQAKDAGATTLAYSIHGAAVEARRSAQHEATIQAGRAFNKVIGRSSAEG